MAEMGGCEKRKEAQATKKKKEKKNCQLRIVMVGYAQIAH